MKKRRRSSPSNFLAMSHCFISSREKMMIFFGLYLASVIGTNVFPKEPVPPVTRMVALLSIVLAPLKQMMFYRLCDSFVGMTVTLAKYPGKVALTLIGVRRRISDGAIQRFTEIRRRADVTRRSAVIKCEQAFQIVLVHGLSNAQLAKHISGVGRGLEEHLGNIVEHRLLTGGVGVGDHEIGHRSQICQRASSQIQEGTRARGNKLLYSSKTFPILATSCQRLTGVRAQHQVEVCGRSPHQL